MKKLYGVLVGIGLVALLAGCGGKVDENRPIDQVTADAAKMGKADLQKMVDKYEAAIAQKGEELEALKSKIKEIPLAEMMSDKTKTLKDEVSKIAESTGKLKDRMAIYAKELTAQK